MEQRVHSDENIKHTITFKKLVSMEHGENNNRIPAKVFIVEN